MEQTQQSEVKEAGRRTCHRPQVCGGHHMSEGVWSPSLSLSFRTSERARPGRPGAAHRRALWIPCLCFSATVGGGGGGGRRKRGRERGREGGKEAKREGGR